MILVFNIPHRLLGVHKMKLSSRPQPVCHARGHRFNADSNAALLRIRQSYYLSHHAVDAWNGLSSGLRKQILSITLQAQH